MLTSSLGIKLQELRNSRNLTQKQVSESLNIGRASYAYYELDKRTPDLQTLLSLCKFYQVEISELVNETTVAVPKTSVENNINLGFAGNVPVPFAPSMVKLAMNIFSNKEKDFINLFRQLTTDNQNEILHMIKYKIKKQKK